MNTKRNKQAVPREQVRRVDTAVVFVHGIGSQARGSTLEAGLASLRSITPGLKEIERSSPEDLDAPWTALVELPGAHGGQAMKTLLVDGWWDDVVNPPGASQENVWRIWRWVLLIVPSFLVLNTALAIAASFGNIEFKIKSIALSALKAVLSVTWRLIILPPLVLLGLVIGTILAALDPLLRRLNAPSWLRVQNLAQLVIGDAWAFCIDESLRNEILARVDSIVRWTKPRAKTQVVVAHSQGGAISRIILAKDQLAQGLVTLGSGSAQLRMARHYSHRKFWITYGWLVFLGFVPFIMLSIKDDIRFINYIIESVTAPEVEWGLVLDSLWMPSNFILLGVYLVVRFMTRKEPLAEEAPIPKGRGYWMEIISRYDLVCTGGVLGRFEGAQLIEVANFQKLRQLPAEHVRYYSNLAIPLMIIRMIAHITKRDIQTVELDTSESSWPPAHKVLDQFWWWGIPLTLMLAGGVLWFWYAVVFRASF